jgi:hypothetical protein
VANAATTMLVSRKPRHTTSKHPHQSPTDKIHQNAPFPQIAHRFHMNGSAPSTGASLAMAVEQPAQAVFILYPPN